MLFLNIGCIDDKNENTKSPLLNYNYKKQLLSQNACTIEKSIWAKGHENN
jgi:hypothetical protein